MWMLPTPSDGGQNPLIFKPELVRLILSKRKTMTRRRVEPGEEVCRYKAGKSYSLQRSFTVGERARGARGWAETLEDRIRVVDRPHQERAGDISLLDARAEGFRTTAEFKAYWVRLYDKAWLKRMEAEGCVLDESLLVERFESAHADKLVWVVRFELVEAVRLLHRDSSRGYTANSAMAFPGVGEAVDEKTLEGFRERGEQNLAAHRARAEAEAQAEVELVALHERLRVAMALAARYGIDTSGDSFVIEQRLAKLERRLRDVNRAAAA
jgi:hypothetical protein